MGELRDIDSWIAIGDDPIRADDAAEWATVPRCGGVVSFAGTVRDHAEGRDGVIGLEYEAYEEAALGRMQAIVDEARVRWSAIGRVALLHRTGPLQVGEVAVVVVVSAPHRGEAFAAAEWAIDTLKATVPIWKKEYWAEGSDWATGATPIITSGSR